MSHNANDLIIIFNNLFAENEQTILVAGGDEPIYLPKDENIPLNRIIFRHDYFASALHEIAHWCIAGIERRKLIDFGYWYAPDGRNSLQQIEFEQVEIKPQALELIFSEAADWKFQISVDNLEAGNNTNEIFTQKVYVQAQTYSLQGLPIRAEKFRHALCIFYKTSSNLCN